ncbi:GCN5-related N-acetyltransferase [Stackebrandtia nassauensis DSM 44728]|uniref:GCN5-related N-acetyltransferase n=1 Tax=Stackebrandtia nassauensis (strain DSM 44728 / CIP 108903 / NRRL B-16338 / NBRC 102104 / LLR-40K-21) TaxID=446470 RepID=D3QAN3_STANL|nr:GCN5-related N-acetyltransferase [Stackebrandtia nassauensis DSM 44728]
MLETERLRLREFTAADVDLFVELDGDPEVMRHLSFEATPRDEVEAKLLPKILQQYREGPLGTWAALDRATGEFLGWFELTPTPDRPGEAELGYRLRRATWGRGLATEGSLALIDKGFGEWGLSRIWAETMSVNAGSRRVMEKAGLRYLRTFHVHFDDPLPGTEHGEVEYALTREEWLRARG